MSHVKVLSPYDGHLIKGVDLLDETQVDAAFAKAQAIFDDRSQWLSAVERIAILERAHALFVQRKKEFAKRSAEEGGKPLADSLIEADRAAQGFKIAIEHMSQMTGTQIPMGLTQATENRLAYTFREPVGVVLAISAFNHPINLVVHQVIPAIAVGCPVLIKPASTTPLSCFAMIELLQEAGLPEGWAQVIMCQSAVAEKFVSDPRLRFLSFIGSGKVGWYLRSLLPAGVNCTLEHGGAAPVIVEPDADVEAAIPLLTKGGFYHAGQVCISVQRIFAHEKVAKAVAKGMTKLAEQLVVGDPTDPNTEVGPLISEAEVTRVSEWVDEAVAGGAKVLCGGKALSKTCYAPTILWEPPLDAKVCMEEIFGPVVCINTYSDLNQAVATANALPFSFQSAVFTKALNTALDLIHRLEAKTVLINDHTAFRADWMPFAGRRQSGFGTGGIPYTMHDMTHEKMMIIKSDVIPN